MIKIIHNLRGNTVEKESKENLGFLLTNRLGDYLSFFLQPRSRYEGWFIREGQKLYKIIENLEIIEKEPIKEIRNYFGFIERKRGNKIESFLLPAYSHSFFYQISEISDIEIILDIKESYNNQEFDRNYKIFQEKDLILVEYIEKNEKPFYLAICPNILNYTKLENWFLRSYPLDRERNSPPFERYVFKALRLKASKIAFSLSKEKEKAKLEARKMLEKGERIKEERRSFLPEIKNEKIKQKELKAAYLSAKNALDSLVVSNQEELGLYAGLPWFFQFWPRDTALSLKAIDSFNQSLAKEILFSLIKNIKNNGKISETLPKNQLFPLETEDGTGWIFKRIGDLLSAKRFRKEEIEEIKRNLEKNLSSLLSFATKNCFAFNNLQETWMDSQKREGMRIEIQALRLNLYRLAFKLTGRQKYAKLERKLKKEVKKQFWNGRVLADGLFPNGKQDFTIRPNIFLAAYIYPKLLAKKDWLKCFENVLPKLWLNWGGLSTIDKENPLFIPCHSGENPKSYHNGDSWFYLNNLTAILFNRFSKRKFKKYIDKIIKASTEEILWKGVIGHHGELSSAEKLKSEGGWSQAWSNALYLEMIDEIFK